MKTLKLAEIVDLINGKIVQGNPECEINKVAKMIKNIGENSIYFHLNKKSINTDSLQGKTRYIIVTEDIGILKIVDQSASVIMVDDGKKAYYQFIDYYRNLYSIPVIGVTGTCGKTTTKDMIRHILKPYLQVHSTLLSQNGLHLNLHYLMGINEKTEAAVFEMGVAYPGNIKSSGRYFKPTIGIITNIGEAHLEGCKTLEKYIRAKGEMLEVLPENGTLIINADNTNIKRLPIHSFNGCVLSFGQDQDADFRAANIQYEDDRMVYTLQVRDSQYEAVIPGYGEHNVYNSLAAIAAASLLDIPIQSAIDRLKTFKTMERHAKLYNSEGITVIDDTWSCNPSSVVSGLEVLKKISNGKKEVLVLGKMQRLGSQLKNQHLKLGETIMAYGGVDELITVGPQAKLTGDKAISLGLDPKKVHSVVNADQLESKLAEIGMEDKVVLFKMSLGKMEPAYRRVVEKYRFS
ncbi:Mur ligase family protein [Neobacillus niacini]|uniref:Mur ligase family protein n=1 Tax=Neobacillus niacini TaxID=86668 RepID=UPI003983C7B8